jgi:hypothetical protein
VEGGSRLHEVFENGDEADHGETVIPCLGGRAYISRDNVKTVCLPRPTSGFSRWFDPVYARETEFAERNEERARRRPDIQDRACAIGHVVCNEPRTLLISLGVELGDLCPIRTHVVFGRLTVILRESSLIR